ncbi:hypothetical protein BDW_09280 [Bdellovibrio bacteriovorus W]|nr:hypothetical protein BDW_09280 [Bdellovibrio bacteriovorus W]
MTIAIKILLSLSAIGFWLFTQKLLGKRKAPPHNGIGDAFHSLTASSNRYLNDSPKAANTLLISSSAVIDALGVFLIAQTLLGDTIRPLLGLMILFSLRQINQAISSLPTPEGMIWRDPGVPSIFVTYGVSNDLFFSGHTALAVLGALELMQLGSPLFSFLGAFVIAFQVITVLLLRAHWTMDVFTGAIAALWTHQVVLKLAPSVDQWITSITG